jgi:hypothetical protein
MALNNSATNGAFIEAPPELGIDPNEVFTNSLFSAILNNNISRESFISITISPDAQGTYLKKTTTIIGIITDDSLSIEFGGEYSRPFENVIDNVFKDKGKSGVRAFANMVYNTGTALYNPAFSVPQWQKTKNEPMTFTFRLIATSNPINQVELPILLLSKLALPIGAATDKLFVTAPGPKLDAIDAAKILSKNQDAGDKTNLESLVSAATYQVSINYGGLARFNNCIITNVKSTVPNRRTINEHISGSLYSFGTKENAALGHYIYSDVTLSVANFFPPQFMNDGATNFNSVTMFPNKYTNVKF